MTYELTVDVAALAEAKRVEHGIKGKFREARFNHHYQELTLVYEPESDA